MKNDQQGFAEQPKPGRIQDQSKKSGLIDNEIRPQHTPGPWLTAEGSYGNYVAVVDGNGKTIARIPWGGNDGRNAQLIAAAPELLEAIRGMIEEFDHAIRSKDFWGKSLNAAAVKFLTTGGRAGAIREAKSAIAKAERRAA